MSESKKENAVVFGLTKDHIFAVACVMMDLKRYHSSGLIDEVVIFHDGVSKREQYILNSIIPTRFIRYQFPIKDKSVLNASAVKQFTKMVFTKFECLRLLDDYKTVLWLDYDMVIQSDISELFSYCKSGIKMMPGGLPIRGQLHESVDEYDMESEGICACVFVFQDHLKIYDEMYQYCYNKLSEYADILYMPEQAIFDFMIQKYKLEPIPIDGKVYSAHPNDEKYSGNAKIIHSYSQPKFWNGIYNEQWKNNYSNWLKMGGSGYKPPNVINRIVKKLNSIIMRYV